MNIVRSNGLLRRQLCLAIILLFFMDVFLAPRLRSCTVGLCGGFDGLLNHPALAPVWIFPLAFREIGDLDGAAFSIQ